MRRIMTIVIVSLFTLILSACEQKTQQFHTTTTTMSTTVLSQQEAGTTTEQQGARDPLGVVTTKADQGATTADPKESTSITTAATTKTTGVSKADLTTFNAIVTSTSKSQNDVVETMTTETDNTERTQIQTTTTAALQTTTTVTRSTTEQPVTTVYTVETQTTMPATSAVVTQATAPEKPEVITPLTALKQEEYYGYALLGEEAKGPQLQEAYRRIVEGVEAMETAIAINDDTVQITDDELMKVWHYYRLDYPQHFWADLAFSYEIKGDQLHGTPSYRMSKEDRDKRRADMEKTVAEILSTVSGSWSEYERELAIHDALCERLMYSDTGKAAHNADGALVDGIAVCEGYAESFQYLLYRAGIQCLGVNGTANLEGHKWNVVRLDGEYYYVDITWDDPLGTTPSVNHSYFNISDALLQRDHVVDQPEGYPVPVCNKTTYNYFVQNGGWITEFSVDAVASHIRNNGGKAEFYVVDTTAHAFIDWFFEHADHIAEKVGAKQGYSISHGEYGVTIDMT